MYDTNESIGNIHVRSSAWLKVCLKQIAHVTKCPYDILFYPFKINIYQIFFHFIKLMVIMLMWLKNQ